MKKKNDALKDIADQVRTRAGQRAGASSENPDDNIDSSFVKECIDTGTVGDAYLYVRLYCGKIVYLYSLNCWFYWDQHVWKLSEHHHTAGVIGPLVEIYLEEFSKVLEQIRAAEKNGEEKSRIKRLSDYRVKLLKRVARYREPRAVKSCMETVTMIPTPLTVSEDKLNQVLWKFPVENGVLNLKTGDCEDGDPDDYITVFSPIEFKGLEEPSPVFDEFLPQVLGSQEMAEYMLRVIGYAMTGQNHERIFMFLYGRHGQNGKGALMKVIDTVFGQLSGAISVEMFLKQRMSKNAGQAAPEVLDLMGRRIIWAEEPDDNRSFSPAAVKRYSGGGRLSGRGIRAKEIVRFDPTHTCFLLSNEMPHVSANDQAFWTRFKKVDFPFSFIEEPDPDKSFEKKADRFLNEKLEAESSGILARFVEGCLRYQSRGLDHPAAVQTAVEEYRRQEDDYQDFIDECLYKDDEAETRSSDLYTVFEIWWKRNVSKYPPKSKRVGMDLKEYIQKGRDNDNQVVYIGVAIKLEYMPEESG